MRRITQGCLLATGLLAAGSTSAVVSGPRGQGQVLVFPYYNAQAGNTTLIALANNTDRGKVVQLRVAEGEIGETAFVANVYVGARDSWSAAITGDGGTIERGVLLTDDASCVMPALPSVPTQPTRRLQPLRLADTASGDPTDPARTREGWVEAIEIASVLPNTPTARLLGRPDGTAADCAGIAAAWTRPNGYWVDQPRRDLANPRGGLSGYSAVINVAAGTFFGAAAVALDEFRVDPADRPGAASASVVRHLVPTEAQHLTLADATSAPDARTVTARIVTDGRLLELSYPAERAIDAVSAVLAAAEISADFDTRRDLGATTSFVLSFPTKRFYTNPSLLPPGTTTPLPPFRAMYNTLNPLGVTEHLPLLVTDREGRVLADSYAPTFGGCETGARHPATALAVTVPGGGPRDPLLDTRFHGTMSQVCGVGAGEPANTAGTVTLDLRQPLYIDGTNALRPSREGARVEGLPVVALRLINYINTGAQPGVLANYSAALPVSGRVSVAEP